MDTICNKTSTYCRNGCCYNTKLYCCYKTCSWGKFCTADTVEDSTIQIIGEIIGVAFFLVVSAIIVYTFMKFRTASSFSGGRRCSNFCRSCSNCINGTCSCDCIDKDKCRNCVGCVFLSPCLFVVWLRQEWRKRVQESENNQTTHGVQNNTQENQNTLYTERQISDNGHRNPSAPPDVDNSIHGVAVASIQTESHSDPPSYDEAMKHGPPSYSESHQYSKEKV